MRLISDKLGALPPALLLLTAQAAAQALVPTAIRKMPPDSNEKFFPEYVAFASGVSANPSYQAALFAREQAVATRDVYEGGANDEGIIARFQPAMRLHREEATQWELVRRAGEVLKLLAKREACPANMSSCSGTGHPNKCCFTNEKCVDVQDSTVGNVACCPKDATCNGGVGACPPTAVTCPASLGGGCCIPGHICKGEGCVPSPKGDSSSPAVKTLTTTSTTFVNGSPSTVIVVITTTKTSSPPPVTSTSTSTSVVTEDRPTTTSTSTKEEESSAGAPFRATSTDSDATAEPVSPPGDFCPQGFYACLARAGGGCCRTERGCATSSCPPTPMTTIISGSLTIAVPVTDVPEGDAIKTCATKWYLCGDEAGPVAGCCPDGYTCGTASCTMISPERTAEIQKEFPSRGGSTTDGFQGILSVALAVLTAVLAI